MPTITTAPVSPERWPDVVAAMTGGGDGGSCWCRWFELSAAEWAATGSEQRREQLRTEIVGGRVRGLLAYVDGAAAGWVRIAPRLEQGRLRRSRIAKASPSPGPDVWAITCLQVRREHRGLGIVGRLIAAAVEFAREQGASAVEAYPVDTMVTTVSNNDLFHGPASAFLAHGFTEVARPTPSRPVVRFEVR